MERTIKILTQVTAFQAGFDGNEQVRIALRAIADNGGSAQMSEIIKAMEARLQRKGLTLSGQGKASLRCYVNKVSVDAGYIYPHEKQKPGWRITPKGRKYLAGAVNGRKSATKVETWAAINTTAQEASMKIDRVLLARVGYMTYYAGPQKGDEKPKHGGSYNVEEVGHEVYNFTLASGSVYGFFQPYLRRESTKPTTVNLGRIDPVAEKADCLKGVLVVFVSLSDEAKGQVIVGWYRNATVFREYQKPTTHMRRHGYWYNLQARSKHAVLLPERFRSHIVPVGPGAFGQANVVYPFGGDGDRRDSRSGDYSWIGDALRFVNSYDGPNLLTDKLAGLEEQIATLAENTSSAMSGQGFRVSPAERKMLEAYSVKKAKRYFERLGYNTIPVGMTRSYDLECRKDRQVLRVEVKGTQTKGESVVLTPNEVSNAKKHSVALFVLHSIGWLRHGRTKTPTGGHVLVRNPWEISTHGKLKPISYMYKIGNR